MNITLGYNPEEKRVTMEVQSNLLKKYFENFIGFLKKSPNIPEATDVIKKSPDRAEITFPEPSGSTFKRVNESSMSIGINMAELEVFYSAINNFVNIALGKEFKSTEFIPLQGYPQSNLVEDLKNAIKEKRNLSILESYSVYLEKEEDSKKGTNDYAYNEYRIEYGTPEYADVVVMIYQNKMDELNEKYLGKLKKNYWI